MAVSLIQRVTGLGAILAPWYPSAPTLHAAGDRVFILVLSNGTTAQYLTENPGAIWHLLGHEVGNPLVDPQRMTVIACEVPESGVISMPKISQGNRSVYNILVMRKDSGNAWRDALGGDIPWIYGASDPVTSNPLEGTPGPFTGYEPHSGDALVAFGGIGDDFVATPSSSISADGVSGGTFSHQHLYTGSGDDATMEVSVWTNLVVDDEDVEDMMLNVVYSYGVGSATGLYGVVGGFPVRQTTLIPGPPRTLTEIHDGDSINLSWLAPSSGSVPTSYEVRLDGGSATDIGLVLTHEFTGLVGATPHDVEVRAKNVDGVSIWVGLYDIVTSADWPDAPIHLEETHTATTITITWDPAVSGPALTGYFVWIGEDGDWAGTYTDVEMATEHTFTGLTPDTIYNVQVQAYNEVDGSEWAGLAVRTTALPPPRITWDDPDERYYHTGVDRGVLYMEDASLAWNGITGVTESGGGSSSVLYRDGNIYFSDVEASDFSGSLTAFFWPDKFSKCLGMPEIAPGFHIDNQRPTPFGLSYRSLIGSGAVGDRFGYQLHLVYNAKASIGSRTRKTLTETPNIMEFSFDLVCTPVKIPGFRPSAHFIIDTRNLDPAALVTLEDILYGNGDITAHLPAPSELYDILSFGSGITFVDHGDGTWTASGSSQNLIDNGDGTIQILNVNGTDNGDGTYILEDTP